MLCGIRLLRHLRGRREQQVHKKQRPVISVSSCSIVKHKPRTFQIAFREKGGIVSREYEAETKMECAEIVAKVNFLMTLNPLAVDGIANAEFGSSQRTM